MRAAQFFNIAPDRFNNSLMMLVRIEFEMFEHILLHINRVYPPAVSDDGGGRARVVAAPGAEVADLHALA